MSEPLKYDMSRFHLQDHQHASGCPADPYRQDVFVAQTMIAGPRGESVRGPRKMQSRCMDCAAERLFELDETELAEVEERSGEEVGDGPQ